MKDEQMTVGKLKELLETYPEDTKIAVRGYESGYNPLSSPDLVQYGYAVEVDVAQRPWEGSLQPPQWAETVGRSGGEPEPYLVIGGGRDLARSREEAVQELNGEKEIETPKRRDESLPSFMEGAQEAAIQWAGHAIARDMAYRSGVELEPIEPPHVSLNRDVVQKVSQFRDHVKHMAEWNDLNTKDFSDKYTSDFIGFYTENSAAQWAGLAIARDELIRDGIDPPPLTIEDVSLDRDVETAVRTEVAENLKSIGITREPEEIEMAIKENPNTRMLEEARTAQQQFDIANEKPPQERELARDTGMGR